MFFSFFDLISARVGTIFLFSSKLGLKMSLFELYKVKAVLLINLVLILPMIKSLDVVFIKLFIVLFLKNIGCYLGKIMHQSFALSFFLGYKYLPFLHKPSNLEYYLLYVQNR